MQLVFFYMLFTSFQAGFIHQEGVIDAYYLALRGSF
jgi:hypothetical protein